jgi:hypothetical protein
MNEFCAEKGFAGWFETSAKENIGIDEAATFLVNKVSFCYRAAKFLVIESTHAKISHLVANLPTSRQQVVFALLVPSCQHVWNKL